jgi:hypothetical protein
VADGVAVMHDGAVKEEAQAYGEELQRVPGGSGICSCGSMPGGGPVNKEQGLKVEHLQEAR